MEKFYFKVAREQCIISDEDTGSSVLCVFEIPEGLPRRLEACLAAARKSCTEYCRRHILPMYSPEDIIVYKLCCRPYLDGKYIYAELLATLSDRRSCKILQRKNHLFKYKIFVTDPPSDTYDNIESEKLTKH